MDELDELALNVNQKDFGKDSLMGIPGEVPIDVDLLKKLENIKEKKPVPRAASDSKADDEHLRYLQLGTCKFSWTFILGLKLMHNSCSFRVQQRHLEDIVQAMGTLSLPSSGKPFKVQRMEDLLDDLDEKRKELGDEHPVLIYLGDIQMFSSTLNIVLIFF